MIKRPPIIVVMGHVDHGKTTLLDYIRKTNVAAREAGGITQTIGAYEITHTQTNADDTQAYADDTQTYVDSQRESALSPRQSAKKITFIDTPGHEAFSRMRARGAQVADLAILVVAADDGVMPQTKESIEILKNSKTPFIVAINKIDRPNADINKTKQQLAEANVFLEGYGGNVSWQAISAKTGQGVHELLDLILLAAELEDLKFDPKGQTKGIVLTAHRDPQRGNIVTVIVKNGELKIGQAIATTTAMGKIKALENFLGEKVAKLEPSTPAIIYGFENLPQVGEEFFAGEDTVTLIGTKVATPIANISEICKPIIKNSRDKIKLILRADEIGSLEALEGLIEKLKVSIPLTVINSKVGNIYENEIKLAASTGALIIGFKVKIDKAAENLSKSYNLHIISSDIIYNLEKNLKEHFEKTSLTTKGELKVLAVFGKRKDKNQIIGGRLIKGMINNKDLFEIFRSGAGEREKIGKGKVLNLQVDKKDAAKAETGQEVGLLIESDQPIEVGYILRIPLASNDLSLTG